MGGLQVILNNKYLLVYFVILSTILPGSEQLNCFTCENCGESYPYNHQLEESPCRNLRSRNNKCGIREEIKFDPKTSKKTKVVTRFCAEAKEATSCGSPKKDGSRVCICEKRLCNKDFNSCCAAPKATGSKNGTKNAPGVGSLKGRQNSFPVSPDCNCSCSCSPPIDPERLQVDTSTVVRNMNGGMCVNGTD